MSPEPHETHNPFAAALALFEMGRLDRAEAELRRTLDKKVTQDIAIRLLPELDTSRTDELSRASSLALHARLPEAQELLERARSVLQRAGAGAWTEEELAPVRVGEFLLRAARSPVVSSSSPWPAVLVKSDNCGAGREAGT